MLKHKKFKILFGALALIGGISIFSFCNAHSDSASPVSKGEKADPAQSVNWMSFDMAVERCNTTPKKVFVDIYTQWCGWCKKMDRDTYTDKDIIDYINKNFYAVRLDAETQDTFHFNNHIFVNATPMQRGSVNELAYSLLNGNMSYPTLVFLDEKFNRITIAPGYLSAGDLKPILVYFAEEKYKTESYDDYKKSLNSDKSSN